MIRDYQLLKNCKEIISCKNFIIWGAGKNGRLLADQLGIHTDRIEFVDSDISKVGYYNEYKISEPKKVKEYAQDDLAIVISSDNLELEQNILTQIEYMGYQIMDIYTWYAMETVLYFLNKKCKLREHLSKESLIEEKIDEQDAMYRNMCYRQNMLEQIFLGQLSGNPVFVYQSKKVGSITLVVSSRAAGVYSIHVHSFDVLGLDDCIIANVIKNMSGKIITIVREPIARQISLLWHYLGTDKKNFLRKYNSFDEIEKDFFSIPNREDEFEWYNKEIRKILDIDIYNYPFDREKGYTIIEKNGISLLLLKLEKMNCLEKVIGDFLGVKTFKLIYGNNSSEKGYKYAYEDYKKNVRIPYQFYSYYYINNRHMDYFYTEEEKKDFYKYWGRQIENLSSERET